MPLTIAVGTASPIKERAMQRVLTTLRAFDERFTDAALLFIPAHFAAIQPFGLWKTFLEAEKRARTAREHYGADIGVGIQAGLVEMGSRRFTTPAVVVSFPREQVMGRALGTFVPVPTALVQEIRSGMSDLGYVVQQRTGDQSTDPAEYLSKGLLDTESILVSAIRAAFAVIINTDEYRTFNPNA